jgi:hypothetical protein
MILSNGCRNNQSPRKVVGRNFRRVTQDKYVGIWVTADVDDTGFTPDGDFVLRRVSA